ncbi:MAG TPA: ATP-binding protein [Anaerolineae bacterium]|nr:ATP-binding protein [Anaerolineae bacterium]
MEHTTLKNAYNNARSDASRYLAPREWISWLILSLRFLALTLAVLLSFIDRSQTGVIVPITHITLAAVAYNVALVALARYVGWLRQTLNVLVIDTLFTTAAVFLTGGYHSGFFIVYFFIVTGAAFYLNLVAVTLVSIILGLIYIGACFLNPAGIGTANATFILAGKVVLLLLVALLCGLLLEQLRREHSETERERALSTRLTALNDLFQQLTASLELEQTLKTVVDASRRFLDADVTLALLRREDGTGLDIATSSGLGTEVSPDGFTLDRESMERFLAIEGPYLAEDAPATATSFRHLLQSEGIDSLAVVGLPLDQEKLGVLCTGRRSSQPYSETDMAFLKALAQEAALAIRNARLYEREREQVQRLQTLEALQASFVSVVSHELRTPLTCIKTSVDMLEDTSPGALPEVREELLHTISHHTSRLETIVEDLLDATRLEAGQLTLSKQPTDVRLLADRTIRAFAPLIENKKQSIRLDLPESLDPVLLDRHRFEQVLTNLISNAHRFAGKGGHIGVQLNADDDQMHLTVSDDGPGIPLDQQQQIFEKFYVVADGRQQRGVGLGLYITRQLVELHGGRIWVESEPGKGSAFHVTIPNSRADPSSDL